MYKKIVLAGGSGYIGTVLTEYYKNKAEQVIVLSRSPIKETGNIKWFKWDAESLGNWVQELEETDILINLCGKNVNCRYKPKNQQEIFSSRLIPTALLGEAIKQLKQPPKLWLQAASATIYRHAEDRWQDETEGEIGEGFSVEVCKAWEGAFWQTETPATKKIALRVGIVMGRKDGAFPRLLNLVKFGLGGHQGAGNQMISWIHEHDLARITEWMLKHGENGATYNCTAPVAVNNKDLMKLIRKSYGMPIGLPSPQWLLKIGAKIIGTETELILKSRWVYPERLLTEGFEFQYVEPAHAIDKIIKNHT